MSASALEDKLRFALDSRRARNILRRLPSPERKGSSNKNGEEGDDDNKILADFVSNDYLSLASSKTLRSKFLDALHASPSILGSRGSRLLVNPTSHDALESRLCRFFNAQAALLFNSGFDANAGVFASLPQPGDVAVIDEAIHASVHDGLRASRLSALRTFRHNDVDSFRNVLLDLLEVKGKESGGGGTTSTSADANAQRAASLRNGTSSIFIAVESLYSMDGTLTPLPAFVSILDTLFPHKNAHLIVDEAHATGLFGPGGRGLVAHYGLEDRVLVRVHTFGKALASSGAVVLTNELVKSYLLNYARPLIYTTALSCANVVAINCSFDLLEDGTTDELARKLRSLVQYTLTRLRHELALLPPNLVSLPPHLQTQNHEESPTQASSSSRLFTPIIPIMTSLPRPLSAHLRTRGLNARPITWPTVPKGKDRVRVCLHAANTREEVDSLCDGIRDWARAQMKEDTGKRMRENGSVVGGFIEAKL